MNRLVVNLVAFAALAAIFTCGFLAGDAMERDRVVNQELAVGGHDPGDGAGVRVALHQDEVLDNHAAALAAISRSIEAVDSGFASAYYWARRGEVQNEEADQ